MSTDSKRQCFFLVTHGAKEVLTQGLARDACDAVSDLCTDKGWEFINDVMGPDQLLAEISFPSKIKTGDVMRSIKAATTERVFEIDPHLKTSMRGQLWDPEHFLILRPEDAYNHLDNRTFHALQNAASKPGHSGPS